jgi:hypothetical protein
VSNEKRPNIADSGSEDGYGARLFIPDLDGEAYGEFDRYRRMFAVEEKGPEPESTKGSDVSPELQHDLPRAIDEIIRQGKASAKKHENDRRRMIAAVLRKFDRMSFEGPSDWINRKSFKDSLREVLTCFLNQSDFVSDGCVLIPEEFQLSGGEIGPFHAVKPEENVHRILLAALVWRARKTLGLLWTLAENTETGAPLRLAQIVVPFVKAVNEKAAANPGLVRAWSRTVPVWPVMKSPHRDFDTEHRALLKELQVGAGFPFTITEESRWTALDPVGKWAIHLCQTIEIMIVSDYTVEELSEMWGCKIHPLGSFSGETWESWWIAAKALLVCEYVDVVQIPELNQTVSSSADRRSPGRIRKRIYQALKDKFRSMALQNKVR